MSKIIGIKIGFTLDNTKFEYTIPYKDIDMKHYDNIWDYWVAENENKHKDAKPVPVGDDERVFEITADKAWNIANEPVLTPNNIYINVYDNMDADDYSHIINTDEITINFIKE